MLFRPSPNSFLKTFKKSFDMSPCSIFTACTLSSTQAPFLVEVAHSWYMDDYLVLATIVLKRLAPSPPLCYRF